jgi:hypothetical protein
MTETDPQQIDPLEAVDPAAASAVGPEPVLDDIDTSPRPEDGEQPDDQTPGYEEAESDDNDQEDDPEVHEVA